MKISSKRIYVSLTKTNLFKFCVEVSDFHFDLAKRGPDLFEDFTLSSDNYIFNLDKSMVPQPLKIIRLNKQLQSLKIQKNNEELESFFRQIQSPNQYSYNIMIDHYLSQDSLAPAQLLLSQMDHPNSVTFSCFAKYFLNRKDLVQSLTFIKSSIISDFNDNYTNYLIIKFFSICVKLQDFEKVHDLFGYLQQYKISLTLDNYITLVKILIKFNQMKEVHNFLAMHHNFLVYKAFFLVLTQRDNFNLAKQIVSRMQKAEIRPDAHMFKVLIYEYYQRKNYGMIIDLYENMDETEQSQLQVVTSNYVLKAYGDLHKTRKFMELFEKIDEKTQQTYNIALRIFGKLRFQQKIDEIIKEMERKSIYFNHITYNILANYYGQQGEVQKIKALIQAMKNYDLIPDHFIYQGLIMAHGKHRQFQEVLNVVDLMDEENVYVSKQIYGQIIDLFSFYDITQFHAIVNRCIDSNTLLDENNYLSIIEGYFKYGLYQQAQNYYQIMKKKFKTFEQEEKIKQIMLKVNKMKSRLNKSAIQ